MMLHVASTNDIVGRDKITIGDVTNSPSVIIGSNNILATPPPEPVPWRTLQFYLQKASSADRCDDVEPAIQRLYDTPMRVQVAGSDNRAATDLVETVQSLFGDDRRNLGLQRVVIVGEAGAGKTPALLKLRSAQARQSTARYAETGVESEIMLPILITLSHLQSGVPFEELISEAMNKVLNGSLDGQQMPPITSAQVPLLLDDHYVLFLLDGLEDVPDLRELQRLRRFMESKSKHNFVITCSTSAYRRQLGSAPPLLAIDDLSEAEAKAILKIAGRPLNPALLELVRNRSHMKIALRTDHQSLSGVRSKGHLLRLRHLDVLHADDTLRQPESINPDTLEMIAESLAYRLLCEQTLSLSEYDLMQHIQNHIDRWHEPYSWRQVADELQVGKGLLVRDEMRRWSFSDNSMLASFAAGAALRVPLDELLDRDVNSYLWRETLSLLIGLVPDETELCYRLIDRDIFTAATCVNAAGRESLNASVFDAIIDVLVERLSHGSSEQRRHVVLQLGKSGHPQALSGLLRLLQREWSSYVTAGIVRAIGDWLQPARDDSGVAPRVLVDQPAMKGIDDATAQVLQRCVSEMRPAGPPENNLDYYRALTADSASSSRVRGLAALGLGFMKDGSGCDVLIELFKQPSDDAPFSWHVVEALTEHKNERVIEAVKQVYSETEPDDGKAVDPRRAQAVYLLGWLKGNDEAADILIKALSDRDANTRGRAVEAMGRLELLDGRERIEMLLVKDEDPFVVRMAAEALGAIGDVDSIGVLKQQLNTRAAHTRWAVQQAIREIRERQNI